MKIETNMEKHVCTNIKGPILFTPTIYEDHRGTFHEAFNYRDMVDDCGMIQILQENISTSHAGVFRGMHFQIDPMAQAKWVQVLQGSVIDIIIDIRQKSPTFGHWTWVKLDGTTKQILYVPKGFAHGFFAIEDTVFKYLVDEMYSKQHEQSISLASVGFRIPLKSVNKEHLPMIDGVLPKLTISEKDLNAPSFQEYFKTKMSLVEVSFW